MMNWRFQKKGYASIDVGIGIDYGRALMIKAGYNGSGINDVVWMGDVVNQASALCSKGNKDSNKEIQISPVIYQNLKKENQDLFYSVLFGDRYEGNLVNVTRTYALMTPINFGRR
ncbi:hypothetical protein [Endozoicomonas sp. SCSIO W0465]|uniref:hypothetical protein n=1 Tax=Endozoicomonas sp. SCSIO W0465 TaxID=2918516 RepID=UPI0020764A7F|nr:hypothetical protein [Endozoicomonas sp. SCSIO W0465]USE34582.1 hypothetical protein MJO57_20900 [Endozoicomonas sp. SCSIO W0465]